MGELPQPGEMFGRYQILTLLGRGGMGVLFTARQVELNRTVALKLLAPDLVQSEEYRARFVREAASLARLESPHVISIYDAGEIDGWLYLATQLVADGDLSQQLARHPLAPAQAVDLAEQIAEGLADAHAINILHRDIKPSNVLLRRKPDGSLHAYLGDFGVAKDATHEHNTTVNVFGTSGYLAPERHRGEAANESTDVYALGCLLWAMLTGAPPYQGTDYLVAQAHLEASIPQLSPEAPGADVLNPVLRGALAKRADQRFGTAAELRTALRGAARALSAGAGQPRHERTHVQRAVPPRSTQPLPPTPITLQPEPPRAGSPAKGFGSPAWIVFTLVLVIAAGTAAAWTIWGEDQRAGSPSGASGSIVLNGATESAVPSEEPTISEPGTAVGSVAQALESLSGVYLGYSLREEDATCAAEAYLNDEGGEVDERAADLVNRWPDLTWDRANVVASAVLDCAADLSGSLVDQLKYQRSDVFEDSSVEYDDCVRDDLNDGALTELLALELSGSGSSVYDAFESGSMARCEDVDDSGYFDGYFDGY